MQLTADTKISDILRHHPGALDVIAGLHPRFANLRNPLLRKVMAPRVTLAQAAGVGGVAVEEFYRALAPLGFQTPASAHVGELVRERSKALPPDLPQPNWLSFRPVHYLDVRPILQGGEDPLKTILQEVKRLGPGEVLGVVNSFEPVPLIKLLGRQGYESHVEHRDADTVVTFFSIPQAPAEPLEDPLAPIETGEAEFDALVAEYDNRILIVDVRNLEMPQPMLKILETLEKLPEHWALYVHHKRVPVYLLPELEERNYVYDFCELGEEDVKMLIRRM